MKHQDFPNDNSEILSLEDEKVRQMIGDLKRIDAPKDFDFRLKARIANATSTDFQPRFLPVLRYVLPLSAILVISVFVVLNGLYFPDSQAVSPVAESIPQTQTEQVSPLIMPFADEQVANVSNFAKEKALVTDISNRKIEKAKEKVIEKKAPLVAIKKTPTEIVPKENVKDGKGGSLDSAGTLPSVFTPLGINSNKTFENLPNPQIPKPLNAQEILSQLGIEAIFTDASWKVKSVKQHSPAEGSGVKVGDVIEAIDGEKLTDKPLIAKTVEVKKLMILRGAEKIEIPLRINK